MERQRYTQFRIFLSLLALLALSQGCSTLSYVVHVAGGQFKLQNRARPIPDVIQDPTTPMRVVAVLNEVQLVRDFIREQGLKATSSYTDYVEWDRPEVTTLVSIAPAFDLRAESFFFPIIGSFPFLGFFDRKRAEVFAAEWERKGYDVYVRPVRAYSTLGFFKDPFISTMIPKTESERYQWIHILIHESVHETVYLKNQTPFNESLANFIADQLLPRYDPELSRVWEASNREKKSFDRRVHALVGELKNLYAEITRRGIRPGDHQVKQKLIQKSGFSDRVNNAALVQWIAYDPPATGFEGLWNRCGEQVSCFFEQVRRLSAKDFRSEHQENFSSLVGSLKTATGPQ